MKTSLDQYYYALRVAMQEVDIMMREIESAYPRTELTPEPLEVIYEEGNELHHLLASMTSKISEVRRTWEQDT